MNYLKESSKEQKKLSKNSKKITNNFIENESNAGEWIEKFKSVTKRNANVKREIFKAIENEVENFDIRVARAVNDVFVTADIKFLKGEF
ncbi:hypothetical protein [Aeribacillus sp. FSL M8-0254]|uniref:hypothetical protein n=1 Tax=Aeribacillus sp. FSL M8-0254 TaxID=2954577 RepID=UPI0030F86415